MGWQNIAWPVTALLSVLAALWLANRRVKSLIEIQERKGLVSDEARQLALRERAAFLTVLETAAPERAKAEQAHLLRRSAEDQAAQQVAEDPEVVRAQVQAERQVIEVRTAVRIQRLRERGEEDDVARIRALRVGYEAYRQKSKNSFAHWLGDAEIQGLSVSAIEELVDMYVAYLEDGLSNTFAYWFKDVATEIFQ